MIRSILSVIAGYVVMVVFLFISFTIAVIALSVERVYKPGVWDVSTLWLTVTFILGLIAAILGGWICTLIARTKTPPKVLAGFVVVLGLLTALPTIFARDETAPPARAGNETVMDGWQHSKTPAVSLILNPIIGCVGTLIGASLVKRSAATSA